MQSPCGYDNGGGRYGDPARNLDDYNCYFPGKPCPQIHPGQHEILADPMFVHAAKGDFQLKAGSPCARKAADVAMPGADGLKNLGAF